MKHRVENLIYRIEKRARNDSVCIKNPLKTKRRNTDKKLKYDL